MTWGKLEISKRQDPIPSQIPDPRFQLPKLIIGYGSLIIIWLWFLISWSFALSPTLPRTTYEAGPLIAEPAEPPTKESFSFVVFGDNRDGDRVFKQLVRKINQEKDLAFAFNTGDFVSGGRRNEYEKYLGMISGLDFKLYHVPGNHDLAGSGHKYFRRYFGPFYYSFDHDNSHFIVLNNAFKEYFDARQFAWLKKDLAAADKENVFVFMHRPAFDPSEIYKDYIMSGREITRQLTKVFEKYGVDYVFAGHIHGYARVKRHGIVYLVTGGAGAPLYLPKDFGGFYHYVRIDVLGDKIYDRAVKVYDQ